MNRFSNPIVNNIAPSGKLNESKILTNKLMGFKLTTEKVTMRNINGQVIRQSGETAPLTNRSKTSGRSVGGDGAKVVKKRVSAVSIDAKLNPKGADIDVSENNSKVLDIKEIMKIHEEMKEKDMKEKEEKAKRDQERREQEEKKR